MDGRELGMRFFVNTLVEELHMKWRFGTTAPASNTSRAAGRNLWRITTSVRVFFMTFDFHIGTSKFDVRIYDGTQCQKE
jgi:hypothetical protein